MFDSHKAFLGIALGFALSCLWNIDRNINRLTDAIVNQHICKVVGNPEEMIKLATKGVCK